MEKLSIEQKATRYDLAIEAAKSIYNNMKESGNFGGIEDLEVIFPELAESEDERIRKSVSAYFTKFNPNDMWDADFSFADIVAWLEKQDGQKSKKASLWKHWKNGISGNGEGKLIYLVKEGNTYRLTSCLGFECDYIELSELDSLLFEKQGEQRSTDKDRPTDYNSIDPCFGKPIDKVESKFKFNVGQWIVATGKCVYLIVKIDDFNVTLIDTNGNEYVFDASSLNDAHLWTIKDAKDGDVLYSKKHNLLWIYKNTEQCVSCINLNYSSNISIGSDIVIPNDTCPATKEQRDLLFQKMKEAGYKWENNQLEEINNKGFVDLGLPSGTLWAKCNLGAEKETDLGLLFQWGDTKGYESVSEHQFSWEDYKFGSWNDLTKYNENDTKLILENKDDPVFVATKGKFKSPTKEQLQELIDCANHKWTTIERVNGMKFWKKGTEEPTDDDSYIFIPAAGSCRDGSHYDVDSWGFIWSASCYTSSAYYAWYMFFHAGYVDMYYGSRCYGYSVRAVVAKNI